MPDVHALRRVVVDHGLDRDMNQSLDREEIRAGIQALEQLVNRQSTPKARRALRLLRTYDRKAASGPVALVGENFRSRYNSLSAEVRDLLFRADVAGRGEGLAQVNEIDAYVAKFPKYQHLRPVAVNSVVAGLNLPGVKRNAPAGGAPRVNGASPVDDAPGVDGPRTEDLATTMPGPVRPPIDVVRAERRSGWQKFWFGVGRVLSTAARWVGKATEWVFDRIGDGVAGVAFVIASPMLLFGKKPKDLWTSIRKVTVPTFDTIGGVARGIVQMPITALGVGLGFIRNVGSLQWAKSWKGAVETLIQPVLGTVMVAAQPLLMGFKGFSDSVSSYRKLTEEEKHILSYDFTDPMLDNVRVYDPGSPLHKLMQTFVSFGAFAVGDNVYVAGATDIQTMRHELIHSTQYREAMGGQPGFLVDYWSDLLSNMLFMDPFTAYTDTRAESEAYDLEYCAGCAGPAAAQAK